MDVGLLSALSHIPAKLLIENNALFSAFHGALTENFIAQELVAQHHSLYYWTSEGTAEVDFIIERDLTLYPLEVKAGISRKKKSLLIYKDKYKSDYLLRASLMNLKKDGNICNIPLYLISQLSHLVAIHK